MFCAQRFALALLTILAVAPVSAEEPSRPPHVAAEHACLNQKERRAEIESGKVVHLATAMRAAKTRMQGTLVRARLCHSHQGLVYVLTVLARDGKVARITVDAVKGALIGVL